jgi:corrinoid protein of di/trimethylamine methyltransferase
MTTAELMEKLKNAIIEGDESTALESAKEALAAGMKPLEIVKASIQPAMDVVGEQFQNGEAFLPELIIAGDAATVVLDAIMDQMEVGDDSVMKGTVILGVVFGDNHDIGKNLVMAVMAAHGFKVIDLGINVPPKEFIAAAQKENADIIAASTLMTTSMPYQREIVELLKAMGKREDHYVVVGGGPVTPEWTKKIGADGYGRDAKDAAALCLKLVEGGVSAPLAEPLMENALDAASSI